MLVKVLGVSLLIAFILVMLYFIGMGIYNHFINSRRRDAEELEYHADRLETLIKKAGNAN